MRLQLSIALAVAALAAPARAEPREPGQGEASATAGLYADDDRTQVVTGLVAAGVTLPASIDLGAHGLVDVVSSASVDVVSAATPAFREVRIELGGAIGVPLTREVALGAALVRSAENDWLSYTPSASFTADLFQRNTRLTAAYGLSHNQVGRAQDPNFHETLVGNTVELGVSQLLGPRTLGSLAYTFSHVSGWQSSPYRYVGTGDGRLRVLERHPDRRERHAVTLSALRYLQKGLALEAGYRFYGDDWGILSHTPQAGLRLHFAEHWDAGARARFYFQRAADFWRERYDRPMRFMSADRELSTFWDMTAGLSAGWHAAHVAVTLAGDFVHYDFLDFARLSRREAVVSHLGVSGDW